MRSPLAFYRRGAQRLPVNVQPASPSVQLKYGEEQFHDHLPAGRRRSGLLNVTPHILPPIRPRHHPIYRLPQNSAQPWLATSSYRTRCRQLCRGPWGIDWVASLIFPQLSDESFVHMTPRVPARVTYTTAMAWDWRYKGSGGDRRRPRADPGRSDRPGAIERHLGENNRQIYRPCIRRPPGDWYVPLGQIDAATARPYYETLTSLPGVELRPAWPVPTAQRYAPTSSASSAPFPRRSGGVACPRLHRR